MELNKVYKGDCLELMKDIPDESIDMILVDPPYERTDLKFCMKYLWKIKEKYE